MLIRALLIAVFLLAAAQSCEAKKASSSSEKNVNYMKRTGAKFLKEVSEREGVIKLKSGMLIEIIKSSTNPEARSPKQGDACRVTYSGELKDGTKFDSGTTSFAPNQVIKGWTEAMQLMAEGDKWKLFIPYDLAYGERGSPPKIPPYSPLVFEIEIHNLVKKGGGKTAEEAKAMLEEAKAGVEDTEL